MNLFNAVTGILAVVLILLGMGAIVQGLIVAKNGNINAMGLGLFLALIGTIFILAGVIWLVGTLGQ